MTVIECLGIAMILPPRGTLRILSWTPLIIRDCMNMTRSISMALVAMMLVLGVAACGSDPLTRGVTGAAIGAGAGAGVSAVTGGKPAKGALIGGAVGGLGGALTAH